MKGFSPISATKIEFWGNTHTLSLCGIYPHLDLLTTHTNSLSFVLLLPGSELPRNKNPLFWSFDLSVKAKDDFKHKEEWMWVRVESEFTPLSL